MTIVLLLLLAQNRVVYTNIGPQCMLCPPAPIRAEVRSAPARTVPPELIAQLKANETKSYAWPDGPTVASTNYQPWMDRPGAIYDHWRDPDLRAWRAAGPAVVLLPSPSVQTRGKRRPQG